MEVRNLTRDPPNRKFLEEHVSRDRFLDCVSTRSPVFRTRPLPKSRREAIAMMLEQPNLIRRPVLVKGRTVLFGFDKVAYGKLT